MKYFFKFLMIMTRNGSFIPRVFLGSAGQEINVVLCATCRSVCSMSVCMHGENERRERERERVKNIASQADVMHALIMVD